MGKNVKWWENKEPNHCPIWHTSKLSHSQRRWWCKMLFVQYACLLPPEHSSLLGHFLKDEAGTAAPTAPLKRILLFTSTLNSDLYRPAHLNGYPMVFNKHGEKRGGKVCRKRGIVLLEQPSEEISQQLIQRVVTVCIWIHCSRHFHRPPHATVKVQSKPVDGGSFWL